MRRRKTAKDGLAALLKGNKSIIIKSLGVLAALAVIAVLLVAVKMTEEPGTTTEPTLEDEYAVFDWEGTSYQKKENIETLLILGIDKMSEDAKIDEDAYINTQQSDLNILVVIDHDAEKISMVQINRDTMTLVRKYGLNAEYQGEENMQLALAHTYGTGGKDSCRNSVDAVERMLYFDVEIDHYISFTMDAVMVLNDEVGGVEVEIVDDFTGVNDRFKIGEKVTLSGEEALQFVRARSSMKGDSTNLKRMERQRVYMSELQKLILEKVKNSDSWSLKTITKMAEYMVSNMGYSEMADLLDQVAEYAFTDIATFEGEAKTGDLVEFYLDEDSMKKQVLQLMFEKVETEP